MRKINKMSTLSEKDKKLVGHIVKKKKAKGLNVYFNKNKSTNTTKYFSGKFYSHKNKQTYIYRSSYELKCFLELENNLKVKYYLSEAMSIPYKDRYKKERIYVPDLMIMYVDGSTSIWEVKPKAMVQDIDVQLKAKACKSYMKNNYPDQEISYLFITEDVLFTNTKEYLDFLNKNRNKNFEKK